MRNDREFDVIVYGASGYTGRLVAEYLASTQGGVADLRWAMAGRNEGKLTAVKEEIGATSTPILVASAEDPASLAAMAGRTHVVLTTVGPYTFYGEPLVQACVEAGTDYVDLCGEPLFMRDMIAKYEAAAKKSGARVVFSCGFDSIPFDLGVWFVQQAAHKAWGTMAPRVRGRVRSMVGAFSGGTAASLRATMKAVEQDPDLLNALLDPFALTSDFSGPAQPPGNVPVEDDVLGVWVAPFIMATINTKNVHRSNLLLGHPYGAEFVYDEMMITGAGEAGQAAAKMVAEANPLAGDGGPKPGEGPTKAEREAGHYDVLFVAELPDGRTLKASVKGDMDPGYGSTSKMIAQSAICLTRDVADATGGIYTSAPIFGEALIKRLTDHAGLTFTLES